MKTIRFPKKFTFTPGINNEVLYISGLDASDVDAIKSVVKTIKAVVINDNSFNHEWDFTHCGEADIAVINFYKGADPKRLLLLAAKYYTKFSPITYILVDKEHKDYDLIVDYAEKCGLKPTDIKTVIKSLTNMFADST